MKNNGYLEIKDYFQQIVAKNKKINEFVGYFTRDLHHKQAAFTGLPSPYLALFKYKLGLDGGPQNTVAVREVGFAVMRTDVADDDFEEQYKAIDECEQMALQILARIRYDNNNREHFLYNSFMKDSVRILPVELRSQSYGVEVFFSFKNPQKLVVAPDEWEDIDSVC